MGTIEDKFEIFTEMIDKAFDSVFDKKKGDKTLEHQPRSNKGNIYESIEDYKTKTGKRFRMTKDQKQRGVSRQEAFLEFLENLAKS